MVLSHPYVIYGTVKKNGTPQANTDVTVKNETTNEEHTVQTNSEGKYIMTITRTDWFPSGASDGDQIKVLTSCAEATTQVDVANYPEGRRLDLNGFTVNDVANGSDAISLEATLTVTESGQGQEIIENPKAFINVDESGEGQETVVPPTASLEISDSGSGVDSAQPQATLSVSETSEGSDAVASFILQTISDSGEGSETIPFPTVAVAVDEAAAGSEQVGLTADLGVVSDSGSGIEVLAVSVPAMVEIAELGQGQDTVTVYVPISVSDVGSAIETISTAITVNVAETGGSTEIISLNYACTVSEQASGFELVSVEPGLTYKTVVDVGSAVETVSTTTSLSLQDAGMGLEALVVTTGEITFILPLKVKVKVIT